MRPMRYPWKLSVFLMVYYMANALFQGYLSLYYIDCGFDSAQIGAIFACVALISIAAQPFWGIRSDRAKSKNRVLNGLALASGAIAGAFLFVKSFAALMLLACAFAFFYTSLQPLGDAVVLSALGDRPFGPARLAGGMSYAVVSLVYGMSMAKSGSPKISVILIAIACFGMIPAVRLIPDTPGVQSGGGRRMSFAVLIKDRELMRLMLFLLPMQMTMGYFYTFFSPQFLDLPGANGTKLGWCYFIAAASEIPYLLLSDRLYERFGAGRLMCVSAVVLSVRWLILALTNNSTAVMLSQILHGWGFIVMCVSMAKHIQSSVPRELQSSGQMLLAMVSYGFARAVGNLAGGVLADAFGRQNVFFLSAGVCALALILFAPGFLKKTSERK
mgnify:CR=1 FL=1